MLNFVIWQGWNSMKYSFIRPRKKSILTPDMLLLFIFFGITLFMLFTTYAFLLFKEYKFMQDKEYSLQRLSQLSTSQTEMQDKIKFIQEEKLLSEKIYTQNTVLKDSIANLFDLVPQRITLSEAKLLKNGLILYGITPNQDIYSFMLQAPLKSIFTSTYSSFFPAENGWLRFVSTNYIDDNTLDEKDLKPKVDEEADNED